MRVLVFGTMVGDQLEEHGQLGGIERYGLQVTRALRAAGHEVEVVQSDAYRTTVARLRGLVRLARLARRSDLVWVLHPQLAFAVVPLTWWQRIPLVVAVHGFETWGTYPRRFAWGLRAADVVTTISKYTQAMSGDVARDAVWVPPSWGIDTAETGTPIPQRDRNIVLLVARLSARYKGADMFSELAGHFADGPWEFVMAGAGQPDEVVRARVEATPHLSVVSSPTDDEMRELFQKTAVFLLPSRATREPGGRWTGGEGFGIVILEAARAGAAVLTSDEGACPETVALLGNGLVASPTLAGFEPGLATLLADAEGREAMGRMGRQRAAVFSPEEMQARVEQTLATAIGQRAKRRRPR